MSGEKEKEVERRVYGSNSGLSPEAAAEIEQFGIHLRYHKRGQEIVGCPYCDERIERNRGRGGKERL